MAAAAAALARAQMIADAIVIDKISVFVPDDEIGKVLGAGRRIINGIRAETGAQITVNGLNEEARGFKTVVVTGCKNQLVWAVYLIRSHTLMALSETDALDRLGQQVFATGWRGTSEDQLQHNLPLLAIFCSELPELRIRPERQYEAAIYVLKACNFNKQVLLATPQMLSRAQDESAIQFPGRIGLLRLM